MDHLAVHWDPASRPNDYHVTWRQGRNGDRLSCGPGSPLSRWRQKLKQVTDRPSTLFHCQLLQDFGDQNEKDNHQAVKTSRITSAAASAIVIESSMVMRLRIRQPVLPGRSDNRRVKQQPGLPDPMLDIAARRGTRRKPRPSQPFRYGPDRSLRLRGARETLDDL